MNAGGREHEKKRVALITWSGLREGAASERLLLLRLAASGADAELVDWSDATCDFTRFDLVILRTCWDYHLRVAEFIEWLRRTARMVPVLNTPGVAAPSRFSKLGDNRIDIPRQCHLLAWREPDERLQTRAFDILQCFRG